MCTKFWPENVKRKRHFGNIAQIRNLEDIKYELDSFGRAKFPFCPLVNIIIFWIL
jgi:hypothetical protein